jgi:putative CocE/NonD family hydrolase
MRKFICALTFCALAAPSAHSQPPLPFDRAAATDHAALDRMMPGLAKDLIARYRDHDRAKYLDTLLRLQLVAGQYSEASATRKSARKLLRARDRHPAQLADIHYDLFCNAKLKQAAGHVPFAKAFQDAFRDAYDKMSDKDAYIASRAFNYDLRWAEMVLQDLLAPLKDRKAISVPDAIGLTKAYLAYNIYKRILPLTEALVPEDDQKRYDMQEVLIKTKDGATLSAIVVRRKGHVGRRPTALVFTIYAHTLRQTGTPRLAAALGYVGVVAFTRGKGASPDPIVPYEHDATDAYALIDWISKQPWSNGKVGMYGGSYNGFTQWAATKTLHPALKTIVPYAANNPADGLPMENNIFLVPNYPWIFYVTGNKYVDNAAYFDPRHRSLNEKWYASGKPYRQIDKIDGMPNPWLQRWLRHPAYDKYWQSMVPYKEEFARINIPVLTITGYYDDGQQSALHYLKQHYKYNPRARHYLLIGPYDHFGAQAATKPTVLRGYTIDPVAQFDTTDVTFQWLDHVLRDGKKPALIQHKINYEVMGANEWRHAPSLEKMSNEVLTLYLTDRKDGDRYELSRAAPAKLGFLSQAVDFADRKTSNNDYYPFPIVGKKPNLSNGYCFISAPFAEPVCVTGTFSAEIKARINKKDMDVGIVLYEVMPDGRLFHLSYIVGRASYARDMSVRTLLTPGKAESISFEKTRMVCRRLSRGSRLLVTLNINKNRNAQINYGTGKDVSDEDFKDAKEPLHVRWYNQSWVKVPIWK